MNAAIEDSERALFDFTTAYSEGTLGLMDPDDAADLAHRASASVHVAANAFGTDVLEGDTPDALMSRMLNVYAGAVAEAGQRADLDDAEQKESSLRLRTHSVMKSVLGLSDDDVRRMNFDRANGDDSPWLKAEQQFVFG